MFLYKTYTTRNFSKLGDFNREWTKKTEIYPDFVNIRKNPKRLFNLHFTNTHFDLSPCLYGRCKNKSWALETAPWCGFHPASNTCRKGTLQSTAGPRNLLLGCTWAQASLGCWPWAPSRGALRIHWQPGHRRRVWRSREYKRRSSSLVAGGNVTAKVRESENPVNKTVQYLH